MLLDGAKRFLVPAELREAAGLDRLALLVGVGEYFEIWNPEDFAALRNKQRALRAAEVVVQEQNLQASLQEVRW